VRESYEAIKKSDPAQADQFLATSRKIEAETEAQLQAMRSVPATDTGGTAPMEDAIETFRAQLAHMSPDERARPAYYVHPDESADGPFASGLVPDGTPDAIQLVAVNPQLVDRSRPPEEIQLITVYTNFGGSWVSNQRLQEFLKTVDWSRVASFVR
jgi:hypothetical protein